LAGSGSSDRPQVKVPEQKERPHAEEGESAGQVASEAKSVEEQDDHPLARLQRRVFKPIQKKIYLPVNRLIDRLGYVASLLLLAAITGASTLVIRIWNNPDEARQAVTVARFYFDARKTAPPRDAAVTEVIRDLTNQLKDFISPSNRLGKNAYSEWTAAQMTVSLQGKDAFDAAEMSQWLHSQAGDCHCWEDNVGTGPHLGATGWVLLGLARMGAKPTEQEIEFVLSNQHRPGWWPTYPSTDDPDNAATYPTAYCTWALAELLRRDLISPSQIQPAAEAVRKGRSWLLNNAVPGKPGRWKDYPNGGYGKESIGASGLVLHVLHRTPGPPPLANDQDWMLNLPAELPEPRDEMSAGQIVRLANGAAFHNDATHHFAFPWLIIATVDAYGQGSLNQRAQAARLFHQIPERRRAIAEEFRDMPWLSAETLIALRHLQGEDVI
jgi:hypothetical protein